MIINYGQKNYYKCNHYLNKLDGNNILVIEIKEIRVTVKRNKILC